MTEVPRQSLRKLGLKMVHAECPAGGEHQVPKAAVVIAAKVQGGRVPCLKCRQSIVLERL